MVIERALEKLRQASNTAKPQSPTRRGGERPRERAPRPDTAGARPRPTFPQIAPDVVMAEDNRVLLPGSRMTLDAHAGAAYRMLRTRLLQKMRTNHWISLAVTSPGAGEGKSLTALNLALSVARERSCDVFVLDLDMRNPSICTYLGVSPPFELQRYFAGDGRPEDVLFSIGIEGLAVAGSSTATENASELLATHRLEDLIDYIKSISSAPIIFIDLPPVLVTDEALLVGPRVDATALVVAEGRTRRDSLLRAKQLLADFSFAGVILNRSRETFGSDGYYGYGYHYGDSKA
jgi:capsular exopolysaccharide synthesis family protein